MIELCLWYTFRGFPTFRNFCVITLSGYFATPLLDCCAFATNLVMFQNVEELGMCKLTQGEGHNIKLV